MTDKRHSIKGDPLYKAARQAEAEHMQRCVEKVASQMTEAYRNKMMKDATEFLAKIGPDCGGSALALEERKRLGMTDIPGLIKRLRDYADPPPHGEFETADALMLEAASRIEDLGAALRDAENAAYERAAQVADKISLQNDLSTRCDSIWQGRMGAAQDIATAIRALKGE